MKGLSNKSSLLLLSIVALQQLPTFWLHLALYLNFSFQYVVFMSSLTFINGTISMSPYIYFHVCFLMTVVVISSQKVKYSSTILYFQYNLVLKNLFYYLYTLGWVLEWPRKCYYMLYEPASAFVMHDAPLPLGGRMMSFTS